MVWLSLVIGNSRLHWAWWQQDCLQETWHTVQQGPEAGLGLLPPALQAYLGDRSWQELPLYMASVVPSLADLWQAHCRAQIALDQIPLHDLYPTLGIDRALAAYGAGERYGYPVLVIDGGTAITLTGIDAQRRLVGGAIWPGLTLQRSALATGTGLLPTAVWQGEIPPRWSQDTIGAINSGILHSTWAGLQDFRQDWQRRYPQSQILVTGGDGELLSRGIRPTMAYDPNLAWWGIGLVVRSNWLPV